MFEAILQKVEASLIYLPCNLDHLYQTSL